MCVLLCVVNAHSVTKLKRTQLWI